jgi:hypothetical protein
MPAVAGVGGAPVSWAGVLACVDAVCQLGRGAMFVSWAGQGRALTLSPGVRTLRGLTHHPAHRRTLRCQRVVPPPPFTHIPHYPHFLTPTHQIAQLYGPRHPARQLSCRVSRTHARTHGTHQSSSHRSNARPTHAWPSLLTTREQRSRSIILSAAKYDQRL